MQEDYFPEAEIPFYKTTDDLLSQIDFFLSCPAERQDYIQRGQKRVLNEHNYHLRMADLFEKLGSPNESVRVLEELSLLQKKHYG